MFRKYAKILGIVFLMVIFISVSQNNIYDLYENSENISYEMIYENKTEPQQVILVNIKESCIKPMIHLKHLNMCCYHQPSNIDKFLLEKCAYLSVRNETSSLCCFNETQTPLKILSKREEINGTIRTTRYVEATREVIYVSEMPKLDFYLEPEITTTTLTQTYDETKMEPTIPPIILLTIPILIIIGFIALLWFLGKE
jgi:hypothetical protein